MNKADPAGRRQQGAALIVSLVLLMVLTLLAISTMRTAALELLMAGNAQYREHAFQLAESGLQATLRQLEDGTLVPVANDGWTLDLPANVVATPDGVIGQYQSTVRYQGIGKNRPGYSGDFEFLHYELESTGTTPQRGARATHVQGIFRPVNPVAGSER